MSARQASTAPRSPCRAAWKVGTHIQSTRSTSSSTFEVIGRPGHADDGRADRLVRGLAALEADGLGDLPERVASCAQVHRAAMRSDSEQAGARTALAACDDYSSS